jgi:AAA+ superfamily predicted ATPase
MGIDGNLFDSSMTRTKEDILNAMISEMPYQFIGKDQVLPYIKEAMELYAKSQWNAAIDKAKDEIFDLGTAADNLISDAICQQLITELQKLKK